MSKKSFKILLSKIFIEVQKLFEFHRGLSGIDFGEAILKILRRFGVLSGHNRKIVVLTERLEEKCYVHIHGTNMGGCIVMTIPKKAVV